MTRPDGDVIRGTLDLLILKTLALQPLHGWGISQRISELSQDALRIGQGSLYPALQRLEHQGWIDSEWRPTELNRSAKHYFLTATGRRALTREADDWRRYVQIMDLVLEAK